MTRLSISQPEREAYIRETASQIAHRLRNRIAGTPCFQDRKVSVPGARTITSIGSS